MVLAFFVYNLLLLLLFITWKMAVPAGSWPRATTSRRHFVLACVSVVLYTLVIGLRYNVGTDYQSYVNYYAYTTAQVSFADVPFEIGFYWLIRTLKFFDLPPTALFLFTCGIQMTFMTVWLRRYRFLAPWFIYFYFTTLLAFESMNTIRQAMAFMVLLCAISQILNRKPIQYFFLVGLASTLHVSALMFLPMYFLLDWDWISSRRWQVAILLFVYASAIAFKNYLLVLIPQLFLSLGFERYARIQDDLFFEKDVPGFSYGLTFLLLTDLIIITVSPWLKQRYAGWGFRAYYNAYFIGMLLTPIVFFANYIPISRLAFYFMSFKFIVLSFLAAWIFAKSGPRFWAKGFGAVLVSLYFVWFLSAIYKGAAKCAPFMFVFE